MTIIEVIQLIGAEIITPEEARLLLGIDDRLKSIKSEKVKELLENS